MLRLTTASTPRAVASKGRSIAIRASMATPNTAASTRIAPAGCTFTRAFGETNSPYPRAASAGAANASTAFSPHEPPA